MKILLSIRPEYCDTILSGDKIYEFRRTIFRRNDVKKVYLYCNSNIKRILGSFEVGGILEGTPTTIWNKCHKQAGISKKKFFEYFKGSKKAYAIKIRKAHRLKIPVNPYKAIDGFVHPQSFYYIQRIR